MDLRDAIDRFCTPPEPSWQPLILFGTFTPLAAPYTASKTHGTICCFSTAKFS